MPRTGRPKGPTVLCICQRCQMSFERIPSRVAVYCSPACRRVPSLIIPCERCGALFDKVNRPHQRFCSLICANAFDRERHTVDCLNCGKPVHALPSRQQKGHRIYCSGSCHWTFEALQQYYVFWRDVDMSGGPHACWPWKGSTFDSDYGRYHVDKKTYRAHREAFERTWGRLPEKHGAFHTCDTPICCNPYHLFSGIDLVNIQDRQDKDRQAKGSRMALAKLREDDIPIIRSLSRTMHDDEIALMFHVSPACIWNVRTYRSWKHV